MPKWTHPATSFVTWNFGEQGRVAYRIITTWKSDRFFGSYARTSGKGRDHGTPYIKQRAVCISKPSGSCALFTTIQKMQYCLQWCVTSVENDCWDGLLQSRLGNPLIAAMYLWQNCTGQMSPKFILGLFFFQRDPNAHLLRSRRHSKHLIDIRNGHCLEPVRRSGIGMVQIYNYLPQSIVDATSVSRFQSALTELVAARARSGQSNWSQTLSPRIPLLSHPLRRRWLMGTFLFKFWLLCSEASLALVLTVTYIWGL